MIIRPYKRSDRGRCEALFIGNTPTFFGVHELPEFLALLDQGTCPYFVVELGGVVAASGGHYVDSDTGFGHLAWGMVGSGKHRQGIGTELLRYRIAKLQDDLHVSRVEIATSQHSQGFFARHGFEVTAVVADFFAQGLHRVDMMLVIT